MQVAGKIVHSIALADDGWRVEIIDQTRLPHHFKLIYLATLHDAANAIATMQVRGAPLIGATAAYGIALAMRGDTSGNALAHAADTLRATRPTAVNLHWAIESACSFLKNIEPENRVESAYAFAKQLCADDIACNRTIGEHGLSILQHIATEKNTDTINILTHCNAGWLATVDWGTALAPVYAAQAAGLQCHVWVDETRPRNQGAQLTTWELINAGVAHTLICDNAGGHLMQTGAVDVCIVGSDRTAANGDVCNKIGTYLKALAARDNNVPFYVALPSSTIDWQCADGAAIPIENRAPTEVTHIHGKIKSGDMQTVQISPDNTHAHNPAFDITPATLVSGLITEHGCCTASRAGLLSLFPEQR